MNKKTLLIIGIILILALIVVWVITLFGGDDNPDNSNNNGGTGLFPNIPIDPSATTTGQGNGQVRPGVQGRNEIGFYADEQMSQISTTPVGGAVWTQNEEGDEILRYVDRGTGHVFEVSVQSPTPYRISNTTIPKLHKVVWSPAGDRLIYQYLDESGGQIRSFLAELIRRTAEGGEAPYVIRGEFLPNEISEIVFSPDGTQLFFLVALEDGSLGFITDADNFEPEEVFSSPLRKLLAQWKSDNAILLSTKPSGGIPGTAFILNPTSGSTQTILSGTTGLIALPNADGDRILYSQSSRRIISMSVFDRNTATHSSVGFATFADKCSWGEMRLYCAVPQNISGAYTYPDAWYQGKVLFSDIFFSIDTENRGINTLAGGAGFPENGIDAVSMRVNKENTFMSLINKKDGTLWVIRLQASKSTET